MKWKYILDEQPKHDELIIQIFSPYIDHCIIGMMKFYLTCSWEDYLKYCGDNIPNFWWISVNDFIFPDNNTWDEFKKKELEKANKREHC